MTDTILSPFLAKIASATTDMAFKLSSELKDEVKIRLRVGFEKYLKEQASRYMKAKTILGSDVPLQLLDIYVKTTVWRGSTVDVDQRIIIHDDDILKLAEEQKNTIFYGSAGSGKSMLMKYLLFRSLVTQSDRLPMFVELRELNDKPDISIMDFVSERLASYIPGLTTNQLDLAMRRGAAMLSLDGFDEVDFDLRERRGREILQFANQYDLCNIYVSSRPDDSFRGWQLFHVYKMSSFDENQITNLIKKIPYDDIIKSRFLQRLEYGLYRRHKDFLTNPLMAVMMLITFEYYAEIPGKIHLFYELTFEALFYRNDASKEGFKRKRRVDLALDDYKRLFCYFCAATYMKQSFSFTYSKALEIIDECINSSGVTVIKEYFLRDLLECTCMLVQDGYELSFSHRSFQEYFTAYYISRLSTEKFERATERMLKRGGIDDVFIMLSQMDVERFEETWALPQIENAVTAIEKMFPSKDLVGCLEVFCGRVVGIFSRRIFSLALDRNFEKFVILNVLIKIYRPSMDPLMRRNHSSSMPDNILMKTLISGELMTNDYRFTEIRNSSDAQFHVKVRLNSSDNHWLIKTHAGMQEVAILEYSFKLRAELRSNVKARKDAQKNLFSI